MMRSDDPAPLVPDDDHHAGEDHADDGAAGDQVVSLRASAEDSLVAPVGGALDQAVAPTPRDGELAGLLDATVEALTTYVVFRNEAQATAAALWVTHTCVYDQADTTPYLAVLSPERRCGKTRLLDVLELLVRDPWRVVTPSEAVVFRKLHADHPTLLLDEVDAIYGSRAPAAYEGLRAMLNAGHRAGTRVPRCVGDGARMSIQDFDVFSPKALAGIGDLPDTIADRSVLIRLARRAPGEPVAKFRRREAEAELADLRLAFTEWAARTSGLGADRPSLPPELDDRAADSWEPMLALAARAGGGWPERARAAALVLSAGRDDDDASFGIRLLADCQEVFGDRDRLATHGLIAGLVAREESPWGDLHGREITPRRLARLLRIYEVRPHKVRLGEATASGYLREDFHDAWQRYLPSPPEKVEQAEQAEQRRHGAADEAKRGAEKGHCQPPVPDVPDVPSRGEGESADAEAIGGLQASPPGELPLTSLRPLLAADGDACDRGHSDGALERSRDDGDQSAAPLVSLDLFRRAVEVVVAVGVASGPLIAKRCACDPDAAAAALATLEAAGVVSAPNGAKARDVLIHDDEIAGVVAAFDDAQGHQARPWSTDV